MEMPVEVAGAGISIAGNVGTVQVVTVSSGSVSSIIGSQNTYSSTSSPAPAASGLAEAIVTHQGTQQTISGGEGSTITGNTQIAAQYNLSATIPPPAPALHQLRAPAPDFIGREKEIAQLKEALTKGAASGAAVAISGIRGMGGIGKSELALKVAHEVRGVFPDGQLLIELRKVTPEETLKTLIRAFDLEGEIPDDLGQLQVRYRSLLNGRRILVLADDAKDDTQVRPLMPPVGCALLITSRNRFSLPGMATLDLNTLPSAEAEALLCNICPRIEEYAPEIARLCGYLPLALRVSAGLLATNDDRDAARYVECLHQERLKHLKHPDNPDDPQASVEASLWLSYDELNFHAQFILWQLALISPGLPRDWVRKSLQSPYDALEVVQFLRRRNLVEWDETNQEYGLHDLVREFARIQGRAFFEKEAAFRRSQSDAASTLSALSWWVAFYENSEDTEQVIATYKEIEALARLTGDTHIEIGALDYIGSILGKAGRTTEAIIYHEQSLQRSRELNNAEWRESSALQLSPLYEKVGRWGDMVRLHQDSRDRAHQQGDKKKKLDAIWNLASTFDTMGETQNAIENYEEYLTLVRERAMDGPKGMAFGRLWDLYSQQGNYTQAATSLRYWIDFIRSIAMPDGDTSGVTKDLEHLEDQHHRLLELSDQAGT